MVQPSSYFSMKDIYPNLNTSASTSEETIPEDSEEQYYNDKVVRDSETGKTIPTNKTMILGSLMLIVIVLLLLHLIN